MILVIMGEINKDEEGMLDFVPAWIYIYILPILNTNIDIDFNIRAGPIFGFTGYLSRYRLINSDIPYIGIGIIWYWYRHRLKFNNPCP
jgi:hypothetical protein